ncbi:MAG: TetR/AcrR family transcriptional regulator [Clostridia bacterium]|nr:TetR/AcrR family transcriptional regulator [Clostridia bacterium]
MTKIIKKESTKEKILHVSMHLFLEKGYSKTTVKMVCDELQISKGNFTFYFPAKEDVLAELVSMLCVFQQKLIDYEANRGFDLIMSICIELMTVAAACEENDAARDFFISAFQSPVCLECLRNNHVERAKNIFAEQCKDWTDLQFVEAEILVQGIDYATIISDTARVPLKTRISGALNQILSIYNVPEEIRKEKIQQVISMDCRELGKRVLTEFKAYVEKLSAE